MLSWTTVQLCCFKAIYICIVNQMKGMNRIFMRMYFRKRGLGVLQVKTGQHNLRFNNIENPDALKLKMKALGGIMTEGLKLSGCLVLKQEQELAGVLLYKLRADRVTLRQMGSDFCWQGTITEFKRAIRSL